MTSDTVRTQVYLDRSDHRRLRQLAATRGVSMTELAREAVARYVAEELDDGGPGLQETVAAMQGDPLYDGIPSGPTGLVDRMRARAVSEHAQGSDVLTGDDAELGRILAAEHDQALANHAGSVPTRRIG